MDQLVQIAGLITAALGWIYLIRKDHRESEQHKWERQDRDNREL